MATARESCFHCGLPVAPDSTLCLQVDGRARRFCCHGCHAVCQAIVEAGLGDYYRHRTAASGPPAELVPERLQRLAL